jgi:hypothetical protein
MEARNFGEIDTKGAVQKKPREAILALEDYRDGEIVQTKPEV